MMKPPAFQFYAADFLVGTSTMTNEEVGIYIRLLCHQWDKGFVPADKASRLVGAKIPAEVLAKFTESNGELRNERLESERKKQAEYRDQQSQRGKAGAKSRWNGTRHGTADGETMAPPSSGQRRNDGSPSPVSGFQSSIEDPESGSGAFSKPKSEEDRMPSVFAELTEDDLGNAARLTKWLRDASARSDPIIKWSEANLLNVVAAAVHAQTVKRIKGRSVRNRVAVFCSIVLAGDAKGGWQVITQSDETEARKRLAKLASLPSPYSQTERV